MTVCADDATQNSAVDSGSARTDVVMTLSTRRECEDIDFMSFPLISNRVVMEKRVEHADLGNVADRQHVAARDATIRRGRCPGAYTEHLLPAGGHEGVHPRDLCDGSTVYNHQMGAGARLATGHAQSVVVVSVDYIARHDEILRVG